ncbi:MAG: S8 family peptidase [Bacteroidales bacterium]|jgi:subtilisin family serine protease|nr:S8 family peptidase [Bacteroidales bacterium]
MKAKLFIMSLLVGISIQVVHSQQLNASVGDGRVDSVWSGINLPQGYTGKGVIIGFTDWGFDYTHPVFYDTNLLNLRILAAWDQFRNGGTPPANVNYGSVLSGETELLNYQSDTFNVYEYAYHGTHVASIAAGAGADNKYRGVAFEAELLMVTFLVDEQAVIDAFQWMYDLARSQGKRLVINMSWGLYYVGNMDGTGKVAQFMDSLSQKGVIFVTSAGNNGEENFHIERNFSQQTDTLKTFIEFSPLTQVASWGQSISMTNSKNTSFAFTVEVMDNNWNSLYQTDFFNTNNVDNQIDTFVIIGTDTLFFKVETDSCNIYNQSPNARLRVKKPTANWHIALKVVATSGEFHAWNVAELSNGVGNWGNDFSASAAWQSQGWSAGDRRCGIGAPANIDCTISVAAHQARTKIGPTTLGGSIAPFSSYGPTIDRRQKPEISAPGQGFRDSRGITAALSSFTNAAIGKTDSCIFNGKIYGFTELSGTSMSSPFVAGVVALMLEANPTLSPAQIKQIITETAYHDQYTEYYGTERFGYGKINAYAAVKKAIEYTNIEKIKSQLSDIYAFPNPAKDKLTIILPQNANYCQNVQIIDLYGKVLKIISLDNNSTTIDISDLAAGMYIVKANNYVCKLSVCK